MGKRMHRKLAAVAILTFTLALAVSLQVAGYASANYFPPPSIEIYSPSPAPSVHSDASVPVSVRVNILPDTSDITFIRCSLDGGANVTLSGLTRENNVWYWTTTKGVTVQGTAFSAKASLDNVAEGTHTLTVYSHAADGTEMSRSREFTVDYDYVPPQPTLGDFNFTAPPSQTTQTETPPTINTGSLAPPETPIPILTVTLVIVACVAASVFGALLWHRNKSEKSRQSRQDEHEV